MMNSWDFDRLRATSIGFEGYMVTRILKGKNPPVVKTWQWNMPEIYKWIFKAGKINIFDYQRVYVEGFVSLELLASKFVGAWKCKIAPSDSRLGRGSEEQCPKCPSCGEMSWGIRTHRLKVQTQNKHKYTTLATIWLLNITMENPLYMEVIMGKSSIDGSFSMAMLNKQL